LVHAPNGKLSTLAISDPQDSVSNTWSITSATTVRSNPAKTLTIDYTGTGLSTYSLSAGSGGDDITLSSTKASTTVSGNDGDDHIKVEAIGHATEVNGDNGNDTVDVATGDLVVIGAMLTVNGGGHSASPDRTVFKGGNTNAGVFTFTPTSTLEDQGDTLNVQDQSKTGTTIYNITGTKVTRTGANAVNYGTFELLNLRGGIEDSDIIISMNALPTVVTVDGGGALRDNRLYIKGTTGADSMTVGDFSMDESNRSQFEVTNINRMWLEAGAGSDVLHNRTAAVPALMDGGNARSTPATTATPAAPQVDTIVSDAKSNGKYSPVLLGNDGADNLQTTNPNRPTNALFQDKGTTYLVGDYFINPTKEFRLQAVKAGSKFGETGDAYTTRDVAPGANNHLLARRDGLFSGDFLNVTFDSIVGGGLTVIDWLRGRLGITVTNAGIAGRLAEINFHVRQFVRTPGTPDVPVAGSRTYRPQASSSTSPGSWNPNGGEFTGEAAPESISYMMTNPFEAGDVNGDGRISAFDALAIINELNLNGAHALDPASDGPFGMDGGAERPPIDFLDVNGDMAVTAMDALAVINKLNTGTTTYVIPEFIPFADVDAWEAANPEPAPSQEGLWTDEALLALLTLWEANDDDSDE
jgi:hypothetical protein